MSRRGAWWLALALAAWPARAGEPPKVWEGLYEARLVQAMDGTPAVAAQLLEESLDEVAESDPQRGEVLYWLARARWEAGDAGEAVKLLRQAAVDPAAATRARTMLERIELIQHQIPKLPAVCTFERLTCGMQRAWADAEKGGIELRDVGDASALAWDTTVTSAGSDHLLLAIAPGERLTRVSVSIRATQIAADVRLHLLDGTGGRWSSPMYRAPLDGWLLIDAPVSRFVAASPGELNAHPPTVRILEIEDLTGLLSTDRGPNTLYLDELSLE